MAKRYRAVLALLILLFLASIIVGIPIAIFGSQSDVSPGEQAAALWYGVGMVGFGVFGIARAVKVQSKEALRIPLFCAAGAVVSFLLLLVFGP